MSNECLLEVLDRMKIEEIAKMFLVSTRFNRLIRRWPSIFLNKKPDGSSIHLNIYKQPPDILNHFFMIFGDYICTLVVDDLCMSVANKIYGYCPQLHRLYIKSIPDVSVIGFIMEYMPDVLILNCE